ncbi:hypothetical protein EC991_006924 [Linnemannia zychae]|nr:hypothetical protein EC991_006924 [Linnemannia zychae]
MINKQRSPPYNPLDIPDIRDLIVSYLDRKDCLSCIQVSHDWFLYFAPPIWKTIDFNRDAAAFTNTAPEALVKYGSFISRAINISNMDHLQALQYAKVDSLKLIKAQSGSNDTYEQILSDTIRRCEGSLQSIEIFAEPSDPDTLVEQRKHGTHYFNGSYAISQPPKVAEEGGLTNLSLSRVCISREGFSSLLKRCPSLRHMTLHQVSLFRHAPSLTLFTGSKLRNLEASLAQVWELDPLDFSAPSLLVHFPRLEKWRIPSLTRSLDVTPSSNRSSNALLAVMSRDITQYCPVLKHIQFNQGDPVIASALLAKTFDGLKTCMLSGQVLSASTVLGLVAHQHSLTSIVVTKPITKNSPEALPNDSTMQWVYMIPRLCRHLQVLSLGPFVCDIGDIEDNEWVCRDLHELRVLFKGVRYPQNIEACIDLICTQWRVGRASMVLSKDKETVVARVARHLVRFKRLRAICMGTQVYNLPSFSARSRIPVDSFADDLTPLTPSQ